MFEPLPEERRGKVHSASSGVASTGPLGLLGAILGTFAGYVGVIG